MRRCFRPELGKRHQVGLEGDSPVLEEDRPVDLEEDHLVDLEEDHPVDLEEDHLVDLEEDSHLDPIRIKWLAGIR
jgi:hypothetical protein